MNGKKSKQVIDKAKDKGVCPPPNAAKAQVLPPALSDGVIKGPSNLETIGDVIREQQRLYKMVFSGDIALNDLSKLMYSLQNIIQGLKAKSEIDALEDAYIKQWQGVRIIAPEGAAIPDPMKDAIEAEVLRDD
jgi:hypothetical protein